MEIISLVGLKMMVQIFMVMEEIQVKEKLGFMKKVLIYLMSLILHVMIAMEVKRT